MTSISSLITPLFVPANRPERFTKAASSGTDAVILDLEDAVPEDAKEAARDNLRFSAHIPVIVRINAAGTRWYEGDCTALRDLNVAAVVLPKAERVEDLAYLHEIAPVIALVETARGIAEARAMAQSGFAARLAFGSMDYAADLGCDHTHEALYAARAELVLASRLGSLPPPLDGVTMDIASVKAAFDDALMARSLGFGGKLLIHPKQVEAVANAFGTTEDEIDWARRVLASGDGAVQVDGMMIDEPVRVRARAILVRAAS